MHCISQHTDTDCCRSLVGSTRHSVETSCATGSAEAEATAILSLEAARSGTKNLCRHPVVGGPYHEDIFRLRSAVRSPSDASSAVHPVAAPANDGLSSPPSVATRSRLAPVRRTESVHRGRQHSSPPRVDRSARNTGARGSSRHGDR
jgi:hypothetical protein